LGGGLPEDLILVGEVKAPHGLKGFVRASSFAVSETSFTEAGSVVVKQRSGETRRLRVLHCAPYNRGIILKLEGIEDRDEAEGLRGARLFFRKEDLKREDEDEFFWFELIGLKVYSEDGALMGVVTHIIPTGGTDIFVVKDKEREVLIPAARHVVKKIDTVAKTMVVDLPAEDHEV
jgi:16S rRNA processing protein RimM